MSVSMSVITRQNWSTHTTVIGIVKQFMPFRLYKCEYLFISFLKSANTWRFPNFNDSLEISNESIRLGYCWWVSRSKHVRFRTKKESKTFELNIMRHRKYLGFWKFLTNTAIFLDIDIKSANVLWPYSYWVLSIRC